MTLTAVVSAEPVLRVRARAVGARVRAVDRRGVLAVVGSGRASRAPGSAWRPARRCRCGAEGAYRFCERSEQDGSGAKRQHS